MDLKPLAKISSKKAGLVANQLETRNKTSAKTSEEVVLSKENEDAQLKQQNIKQKTNSNQVKNTAIHGNKVGDDEIIGSIASAIKKEIPVPVPPPACSLSSQPSTQKSEQKDESIAERPSLEDGEIHGTDADDTVNEVEDIFLDEEDPKELSIVRPIGQTNKKVLTLFCQKMKRKKKSI
jgi:hypothetical protein